jgi:general stress protein 26
LWFATDRDSEKLDEIRFDPHVNLGYLKPRTMEWVSVSGKARVVDDRTKVRELWAPDWRAWFGDEGGAKDGTSEDPRIILIAVTVEIAMFLEVNKPQPVVLFELAKGLVTGKRPQVGETVRIEGDEMRG